MNRLGISLLTTVAALIALGSCTPTTRAPQPEAAAPDSQAIARGHYLVDAAGCVHCHTDAKNGGARLAGGRAVETPFGAYYSRNITPDPIHGIGRWSDADFLRALRDGRAPDGAHYFPAFPFTAFTGMTDRDILDIKAYLFTQPPQPTENRPHHVAFPYDVRLTMVLWRMLYFRPGPLQPDPARSDDWNRGAYLVNAVSHCGECHTPRDRLGGLDDDRRFAGARIGGPGGRTAPDITPQRGDGIGSWSRDEIVTLLRDGTTPIGDSVTWPMSDVVEGTSRLTDADRRAIAVYLQSLPPLPSAVR